MEVMAVVDMEGTEDMVVMEAVDTEDMAVTVNKFNK